MYEVVNKQYSVPKYSWTVEVHISHEDSTYYVELTDEMLEATGWKIDDTLVWEKLAGNAWTLRKKP